MSLKGDFRALKKLVDKTTLLASVTFTRNVAGRMGDAALALAQAGASAGQTPSGRAWKKTIKGGRALPGIESKLRIIRYMSGFRLEVGAKMRGGVNVLAVDQFGSKGRFSKAGKTLSARQVRAVSRKAMLEQKNLQDVGVQRTGPQIPPRPLLPRRALPRRWQSEFADAVRETFRKAMR